MDWWNAVIRWLVDVVATFPAGAHPLVGLTTLSLATAVLVLWLFGKVSDQQKIAAEKKLIQAYLLELRLYGDRPRLIWKSYLALMYANFRYMGLMLKPAIFLTAPIVVLMFHLDAFYGMRPLHVDESATVTVQLNDPLMPNVVAPTLQAPSGVRVETPALRSLESAQFSWRIRPEQAVSGALRFNWGSNGSWEKSVSAGDRQQLLSVRRVDTWYKTFWNPGEDQIRVPSVAWVEIRYPAATINFFGFDLHWLVWFLVLSMVPAYLLRGFFGVVI